MQRLADKYGETRKGYGLQNAKVIVELYASEETGTWTLIATRSDGMSCAMAVGKAWRPTIRRCSTRPPEARVALKARPAPS